MSPPKRKLPHALQAPAGTADRVAEKLDALPAERRAAFVAWLEREHTKATRPKRSPGRPRLMDEPMSDSITIKLPPAMREEIRGIAEAYGCRNEAEYLRRLHQAFVRLERPRPNSAKRRGGSSS